MAALEASHDLIAQKNLRIAACPLIDKRNDPLYRCVIAATTGCDTLPSGIPGIGAKRLHALIDEKKPIDANALIDIVIAATKGLVTEAELRVVIDALMYEPCNTIELSTEEEEAAEGSNYQDSIRYMFPPPESLDKYLGGFASSGVTVTENVIVAECHGHASLEPYDFLANIGLSCVICKELCCEFCVVDKNQNNKGKPKRSRPNPNWQCLKCRGGDVPIELELTAD